jgi:hypothetical protein
MAVSRTNEFGTVAVSISVLSKMILDDMLELGNELIPCSRKGKILRKGMLSGYADMLQAVELVEHGGRVSVTVFFIEKFGESIKDTAEKLFDSIEKDFDILSLQPPEIIRARVLGVISRQLAPRDVEIVRECTERK